MSQIGGLQDFRQSGPPADVGTFLFPADVLVFQHAFGGATYVCAMRRGERGWILVDYLPYTGANATTVILAALADLTVGRTSKEKVVVMGEYADMGQIALPDYVCFELFGSFTMAANTDISFIVNDDVGGGNTEIEIFHGTYDCNKDNQTVDISTIYLNNVTDSIVHHTKVIGGHRYDAIRGEGIEFYACVDCIISHNHVLEADYDGIKVRGASVGCIIISNTINVPDGNVSGGIQVSSDGTADNVVADNTINLVAWAAGIKIHYADRNIVIGNTIRGFPGQGTISMIDDADYNVVVDNWIYNAQIGIRKYNDETSIGCIVANNYIQLRAGVARGVYLEKATEDWHIHHNTIIGIDQNSIGMEFVAANLRTELNRNKWLGTWGTRIVDNGTGTKFDTKTFQFQHGGSVEGTVSVAEFISATASAKGWRVDGGVDWAVALGQLPLKLQEIVHIKIWAVALGGPIGSPGQMHLEIVMNAGADNLSFATEPVALTNFDSETTDYVANDVVHWVVDPSDDADIGSMVGGMSIEVKIIYEAGSDPDGATNAVFRIVEIEYI